MLSAFASTEDIPVILQFQLCRPPVWTETLLEDYDGEEQTLTVRGKRNKTRVIPIEDDGALAALADWLYLLYNSTDMQPALAGPLFTRILKGGRITDERLSDQGVYHILDTRRRQANLAPFTPHDLRRTFAAGTLGAPRCRCGSLHGAKVDGHANANTTVGYD